MNMELHATGASFISAMDHGPRDLIVELVSKNPNADRKALFEDFRSMLEDNGDTFRRAVEWYFFVNMYDYLVTSRNRRRPDPVEKTNSLSAKRDEIDAVKAQIVLLDLKMPNDKAMRDCTGAEMARFGNRYQKIAERVGKAKLVGAVLNEDQVKAIMK